jgi:hypothetical protein
MRGFLLVVGDSAATSKWVQLDIDGEAVFDYSAFSVAISSDGTVLSLVPN